MLKNCSNKIYFSETTQQVVSICWHQYMYTENNLTVIYHNIQVCIICKVWITILLFCTIYSVIYLFNFLTDFGIQAKQVIRHSIILSVSTTCEIWCELETITSDSEFPGITVHRSVSSRHSGNIMWQQRDIGFLLWLEGSGGIRL